MLFDFNEALSRASNRTYDVCICGTGPAGITTARKLADAGKNVLLLEAGGLSFSDESQEHYKGKSVGKPFWWVETGRLRYFGGTSNHWGGLCAPFPPSTFEASDLDGLPGWPITYDEVIAGIDEAKQILDIPQADFSDAKEPGFPSAVFNRYSHADSPPTRFAEKYGDEIRRSQQIDAFYNANVVDIRLNEDLASVRSLRVQNYKGEKTEVSAKTYVLALGAIETARILLNANSQNPSGVGNQSDMVGRCFMESLNFDAGRFLVTNPEFWLRHDVPIVPTPEFMKAKGIGNGVLDFTPNATDKGLRYPGRLGIVKDFLRETGCAVEPMRDLVRKFMDLNCAGDGIITTLIEQEPNPKSRVSLTDEVDSLGLRRIQINWEYSPQDFKTMRTLALEAAKEMARYNVARVQLAKAILDPDAEIGPLGGHGHHMGTTRMSADPRFGVVDGNCQVHGVRNLYVVGASVYPKCGGRNPTVTVVLLSIRLGNFMSKMV